MMWGTNATLMRNQLSYNIELNRNFIKTRNMVATPTMEEELTLLSHNVKTTRNIHKRDKFKWFAETGNSMNDASELS